MTHKIFAAVFIILISNSCSTGKYAASNKAYKKQAKTFANEIKKQPADIDSSKVGAT